MKTTKFKEQYMEEQEKIAHPIWDAIYVESQEEQEKGEMKMAKQIEQVEQSKPMFTINKDMLVVSTTNMSANPVSENCDAMKLFLNNNFSTLENYFNDENNHGIAFHECGFSGKAQDEFIQSWVDSGVRVF